MEEPVTAKGVISPSREEVRAMNRAIASLRGRIGRMPQDASPADVLRALDEIEAQNQRVREAISE